MTMRCKNSWIIFFFLFLVFFFSLRVIFDTDLGLHLRIGEQIYKAKGPIYGNPFGLYFRDYQYVYHSWLSQLIIFLIFKNFGLYGLNIFYAFLSGLTMFVLHKICLEKGESKNHLLLLAFLTPLVVFVAGLRTRAITFLFLAVLYFLLLKIEKGERRWAFLIPLIFTFWANLHGGFLMGLFFLLLWLIFEIGQFKLSGKFLLLFQSLIFSFFFSLLNPYGIGVYAYPLRMLANSIMFKTIMDWQPLTSDSTVLLFGLLFTALIFLFKAKISPKEQFLFFSLFFLSVFVSRFFLMVVLVTIPILMQFFEFVKKHRRYKDSLRSFPVLFSSAICLLSIFLNQSFQIVKMVWANQSIENYAASLALPMPYKAIKFVKGKDLPQNLLNDYNWGSFLLWQLPQRKIFVDGRMDTFVINGLPFLGDYLQMVYAQGDWQGLLEKYQVEAVFLDKTLPLAKILPLIPPWKKIYEDELAVILTKS